MLARRAAWFSLGFILLILTACGESASPSPSSVSTPTVSPVLAPSSTPDAPVSAPSTNADAPTREPAVIDLTVWAPEDLSPFASVGGDALGKQVADFEQEHPNVHVIYKLKAAQGKGGLVDFVLQVNELVPAQLPDVVLVESQELAPLVRAKLLQPLTREFPAGVFLDLFTPAQMVATVDGGYSNLPLVIEAEHLVYDTTRLSKPPATWDQVIESRTSFAFAADNVDEFLFYYLENGGIIPTAYADRLSPGMLETVLTYYQSLRREQLMPDAAVNSKTPGDAMSLYVNGQVAMAQVDARDFIEKRAILSNTGFAAIPTHDGRPTTLVTLWTFAILAKDPLRQKAAAEFLAWMDDPSRVAEWARIARRIPARKSAYAESIQPQAYAEFLWECLENGIVAPSNVSQQPFVDALQSAIRAVLRGQLSPQVAAAQTGLAP